MKKRINFILAAVIILAGCASDDPVTIYTVTLNKATLSLVVDESETLIATVEPADAGDKTVSWTSSDEDVATVDQTGKVTALASGTVTITAKAGDETASCVVTVSSIVIATGDISPSITWSLTEEGILTISGEGIMPNYDLDRSTAPWHTHQEKITAIVVEDGITRIGNCAFVYGDGGTYNPNLKKITISPTVTSIGNHAFAAGEKLKSIFISASIISIGYGSFYSCPGLEKIEVDAANAHHTSEDGVLFSKTKERLVAYVRTKKGSYTVPSEVIHIEMCAFRDCTGLTAINLPEELNQVQYNTFQGCTGLTSVVLPEGLMTIYDSAFYDCINLASITLPESVSWIGNNAFRNCSALRSVILPKDLLQIQENAFRECVSMTDVTIMAMDPPVLKADAFTGVNATLHVPTSYLTDYQNHSTWNTVFTNIVALD